MKEEKIDIRKLIVQVRKYWYLFAVISPLLMIAAYFFLQTQAPVFQSSALLLVKDDESSGRLNEEEIFRELGVREGKGNLENESIILSSTPLLVEVVKNLNLQYQYIEINPLLNRELYKNSPIQIANWEPVSIDMGLYGEVEIDGKGGYFLKVESEKGDEKVFRGEFGKVLSLPFGKLTLTHSGREGIDKPIAVIITSQLLRAKQLASSIFIGKMGEELSVLNIQYKDVSPLRAQEVVKELIDVYNERGVEMENRVFRNTIALINARIEVINEELTEAEKDVESYKESFGMTELSAEGTLLMSEMSEYTKKVKESEVQLAIIESIESFLIRNKDDFEFIPTNMSLSNPTLNSQLESFNRLLADKEQKQSDLGPAHPDLKLVEKQIQNLRQTIIDNIESMRVDLLIARDANRDLKNDLESRLRSLPRRERELIEIERRKNVKENLYLYLLQKREESAISMAVTTAKGEVIEPPEVPTTPIGPNKKVIWLSAIFLGLGIPTGLLFLINLLNDKIQTEEDLEGLTSLPIAGVLAQSSKVKGPVVQENSRTATAEMFRMLRANLAYISPVQGIKSLLVTSITSGEGKSYIATNLGIIQALSGKKVVLLEMDLRKPKGNAISKEQSEKEKKGIVNYLVDPSVSLHEIISNSRVHENLDIITCGPKPPNPGELILSSRLRTMVDQLREMYDFILIDSPPVGIVADALQIKDIVDASLFVVRADFTPRASLKLINDIAEKDKLSKPFIVLNGVSMNNYQYIGYKGYGYGYSYAKNKDYFEKEKG